MRAKKAPISEETREKMREVAILRWTNPEYREKFSAARKLLSADPEFRNKMSQGQVNAWQDPEKRKRRLASIQTPERNKKITDANRGRKDSDEMRQRKSKARIGMKFSEEHRRRISEAVRQRSPETREKLRQARMGRRYAQKETRTECALRDELAKFDISFEMNARMFQRFHPDFVFEQVKLIVEIDGLYWHSQPTTMAKDLRFNAIAAQEGWTVWRLPQKEVLNNPYKFAVSIAEFIKETEHQ